MGNRFRVKGGEEVVSQGCEVVRPIRPDRGGGFEVHWGSVTGRGEVDGVPPRVEWQILENLRRPTRSRKRLFVPSRSKSAVRSSVHLHPPLRSVLTGP